LEACSHCSGFLFELRGRFGRFAGVCDADVVLGGSDGRGFFAERVKFVEVTVRAVLTRVLFTVVVSLLELIFDVDVHRPFGGFVNSSR